VPQQTNHSDCGLFVLKYIEHFVANMDGVVQAMLDNSLEGWFPHADVRTMRLSMQALVDQLAHQYAEHRAATAIGGDAAGGGGGAGGANASAAPAADSDDDVEFVASQQGP
jgi:hypothetical protein